MTDQPKPKTDNVCPECGYQFQGNGFDGIDAHWRAYHEKIMPYEEAWPLIQRGAYRLVLTREEIAFLDYLAVKSWTSSGLLDHRQFKRLVDGKLVEATAVTISDVLYEITDLGRAALAKSKITTA